MVEPRPTGMRILRPYKSEDEFIRGDGLTIGRMGMILPGAPERPPGIIVRFEIVLSDGQPVFRGEGKVVAHRVHSNGRKGLEVKFTKLDARSKGVVERALELRRTGALTPSPAGAVPDLTPLPVSTAPPATVVVRHEDAREDAREEPKATAAQAEAEQQDEAALQDSAASELAEEIEQQGAADTRELADANPLPPVQQRGAEPEPRLVPEAPADAGAPAEPEARSEAGAPAEPEARAEAGAPAEPEALVEDDAPTPFAPPVAFDLSPAPCPVTGHEALLAPQGSRAELEKLRARQAAFEAPEARESLLDRLRKRRQGA